MQNYGVSVFRLRVNNNPTSNGTTDSGPRIVFFRKIISFFASIMTRISGFCGGNNRPTIRSNTVISQKRAILRRAIGYAVAWAAVYIPWIFFVLMFQSFETEILLSIQFPLQGLINFTVFMSPKVRFAKKPRRGEELTWPQAFTKAYLSKGEMRRRVVRMGGVATSRRNTLIR